MVPCIQRAAAEQPLAEARVTMRDIARHLNISHSTVSRALRNNLSISKRLRDEVHAAAARLGFRPDPVLSALSHYRVNRIRPSIAASLAWVSHADRSEPVQFSRELNTIWSGARDEAERNGYRLEEFALNPGIRPARLEQILFARGISGILIPPLPAAIGLPDWGNFSWEKFCAVRLGYTVPTPCVHRVTADQTADGEIAYESAWRLGYRRIGMVSHRATPAQSSGGYFMGQIKHRPRMAVPPLLLDEDDPAASNQLRSWIAANAPDAILTDLAEMPRWLGRIGVKVPHDIGLAAFSLSAGSTGAGMVQNLHEIRRAAVEILVSLIKNNERGIPRAFRTTLVEGKWVDGHTLPPVHQTAELMARYDFCERSVFQS